VQFPFGFGLSYTSFGYTKLSVFKVGPDTLLISFVVTNRGATGPSDDVPQVYMKYPDGLGEPEWQLLTYERMRGLHRVGGEVVQPHSDGVVADQRLQRGDISSSRRRRARIASRQARRPPIARRFLRNAFSCRSPLIQ
jgi:hypothetical protein